MVAITLLGGGIAFAGNPVPYSSSIYTDSQLESGWTESNQSPKAMGWRNDVQSTATQYAPTGMTSGAMKPYDSSYISNAWLISPGITLEAGKEYTIGIWARTDSRAHEGEKENFKITVTDDPAVEALSVGKIILNKQQYENKGNFEQFTVSYIPEESGDAYFGLYCYSDPDQYALYLTGFSVTAVEQGGEDPDDPNPPVVIDGKPLPYSFDFSDLTACQTEWKSVAGPQAAVNDPWHFGSYTHYAEFDSAEDEKEDNWLISPAIAFDQPGDYAINCRMWINGTLEVTIGTDPDDLSSFQTLNTYTNTEMPDQDEYLGSSFNVTVPGNYYLGFHACSDMGDFMGHRIYEVKVKLDVPVPGHVTDLKAEADPADELKVSLSWTYPAENNIGGELTEITKAELYRNEELISTISNPLPGSSDSFEDSAISEAGEYIYKVVCYNVNGYDQDHAVPEVSSGYVGRPTATYPVDFNIDYMDKEDVAKFTVVDANEDGYGWKYDDSGYFTTFKSTVPNTGDIEMDDYVMTPYFTLPAGYYDVMFNVGCKGLNYEMGYATDRHNPADTFVKCAEVVTDPTYSASDHSMTIYIPQSGDYCFAVHHVGGYGENYYRDLQFKQFTLDGGKCIPMLATELAVTDASTQNEIKALVSWINPSEDTSGEELTSLSYAVVYRDDVEVGRVQTPTPGAASQYTDTLDESGEYTYKVEVFNANGKNENESPEVTIFVGPGKALPYSTSDFSDWTLFNPTSDWYNWELTEENTLKFDNAWYTTSINAYALAPVFETENNSKYLVTIETDPLEDDSEFEFSLVAGPSKEPSDLKVVNTFTASSSATTHKFKINVLDPEQSAMDAIRARDAAVESHIGSGKNYIGLHTLNYGEVHVKSFAVRRTGVVTAVESVNGETIELSVVDHTIKVTSPADVKVYSLDGRLIASGSEVTALTLPVDNEIVIVVACINGSTITRKFNIR